MFSPIFRPTFTSGEILFLFLQYQGGRYIGENIKNIPPITTLKICFSTLHERDPMVEGHLEVVAKVMLKELDLMVEILVEVV